MKDLTLSRGKSFAFCTLTLITKLLESANVPQTLTESGQVPMNLPETISGLEDNRSGR